MEINLHFRVEAACDLEILATSKFSGSYFLEEIKGLSDACGIDYNRVSQPGVLAPLGGATQHSRGCEIGSFSINHCINQ